MSPWPARAKRRVDEPLDNLWKAGQRVCVALCTACARPQCTAAAYPFDVQFLSPQGVEERNPAQPGGAATLWVDYHRRVRTSNFAATDECDPIQEGHDPAGDVGGGGGVVAVSPSLPVSRPSRSDDRPRRHRRGARPVAAEPKPDD